MPSAKDIRIAPVSAKDGNRVVEREHYSHRVVRNSQLHLGVFLEGRLEGIMQFGPSLDKRKVQSLVAGTEWNGFLELNRMAFSKALPRNSESRALGVALRMIRKQYPHIQWVISFADGTQCGDGTIYRAAGFALTGIKKNTSIWSLGDYVFSEVSMKTAPRVRETISRVTVTKRLSEDGASSMKSVRAAGGAPLPGFQLRYMFFIDPSARERLTVPILPFDRIAEMGAGMYLGQPRVK
jgi:hypothetical protein